MQHVARNNNTGRGVLLTAHFRYVLSLSLTTTLCPADYNPRVTAEETEAQPRVIQLGSAEPGLHWFSKYFRGPTNLRACWAL